VGVWLGLIAGATNKPFRIVIRRVADGLFLKSEDEWTQHLRSAQEFARRPDAAVFATKRRLRGVEIIMIDDTLAYEIALERL
jgi:hypothetical protein